MGAAASAGRRFGWLGVYLLRHLKLDTLLGQVLFVDLSDMGVLLTIGQSTPALAHFNAHVSDFFARLPELTPHAAKDGTDPERVFADAEVLVKPVTPARSRTHPAPRDIALGLYEM